MKSQISTSKPQISFFKLPMLLLFALSTMIFSCNTQDADIIDNEGFQPSIVEVLESYGSESGSTVSKSVDSKVKKPTFKTLSVALAQTRLAGTVSSNMLTVFAPTDAAFAKYGLNQKNVSAFPGIVDILLYHVVAGKVFSTDLSNSFVTTLNGAAVQVNLESGVMINTSNVVIADVEARNGVIHAIDDILFPPTQDLVTLASSFDPEFSVLLAAATKAGLAETLMNDGPFTVFAPTNQAFINFLEVADVDAAIAAVNGLPAEALAPILLYHVVSGRVYSSDLSSGPVTTLDGDFELDLATLTIDGNAQLIPSLLNVQATNGVIHVISEVLVP
ncbi:fasciclin domain-containing protein [Mariniflexile sp. HNIBRBA6329]|uniref:fasciclin domain-containing protein n=1 Tax=Mariniflexile sp. HNIBRBA6329 TaxID=3373088 RepID=UPI0037462979